MAKALRVIDDGVVTGLIGSLRQAAVESPAWHLTAASRWRLFRDTLLGHVRVRGAIRPRDLPLDDSCQRVIDAAIGILGLPSYTFDNGELLFRHWLATFAMLPLASSCACDACPVSADDLLCATILEIGFAMNGRVLRDAKGVASLPFVQRLIGVLGLSQQEWERLVKRYGKVVNDPARSVPHDAILARWAARVIALENPPGPEGFATRDAWRTALAQRLTAIPGKVPEICGMLAALDERACCYVTLKAERPQRYINRGTRHWLLRGASAWCSQSLALARDLICDDTSLLYTDSDAIVGMWFPRDASEEAIRRGLRQQVDGFWRLDPGSGAMGGRFPRLAEWLRENLPAGAALDRDSDLPQFRPRCFGPWSVLEICRHRFRQEPAQPADEGDPPAPGTCTRVANDAAVAFRSEPPWLQDENDDETGPVGITSMVWALCGTAFRTHAHEGLCAALEKPNLQLQAVKHGKWLQQLGMPDESLVHLKMDGVGVGDTFRDSPLADFPWLSLQLARLVQRRLVAGIDAALAAEKAPVTLPIDVVYVGGDDVYVILPRKLLDPFLDGFGGEVPGIESNRWKDTAFTFVAACLQPKAELLAGVESDYDGGDPARSDRFAAANLAAARLVTEGLDHVKKDFKDEASLEAATLQSLVDRALAAAALGLDGMTVTVRPAPLARGRLVDDRLRLLRGRVLDVATTASGR